MNVVMAGRGMSWQGFCVGDQGRRGRVAESEDRTSHRWDRCGNASADRGPYTNGTLGFDLVEVADVSAVENSQMDEFVDFVKPSRREISASWRPSKPELSSSWRICRARSMDSTVEAMPVEEVLGGRSWEPLTSAILSAPLRWWWIRFPKNVSCVPHNG